MKHIIETTSEINDLTTWKTQDKKYKEMDILLFAKVHPAGNTRTGEYARYLIIGKEKNHVIISKIR